MSISWWDYDTDEMLTSNDSITIETSTIGGSVSSQSVMFYLSELTVAEVGFSTATRRVRRGCSANVVHEEIRDGEIITRILSRVINATTFVFIQGKLCHHYFTVFLLGISELVWSLSTTPFVQLN